MRSLLLPILTFLGVAQPMEEDVAPPFKIRTNKGLFSAVVHANDDKIINLFKELSLNDFAEGDYTLNNVSFDMHAKGAETGEFDLDNIFT